MLIDSHAHLDFEDYDQDRDLILVRADAAGVERILAIGGGSGPGSLDSAVKLAEQYSQLDATIGIHPHEARKASTRDFEFMNGLASHPKVVAWGEIGLDFHYDHSPRRIQEEIFIRQLTLARVKRLPVIIHTREAEAETMTILKAHWGDCPSAGVLHCFTGTMKLARESLEMGFFVSFSGILTFPGARDLHDVARGVPLDRLLIETDSPFLAPVPHRGRRNEPAYVVEVAKTLAQLKGISLEAVAEATTSNYKRLFSRNLRSDLQEPLQ